MTIIPMRSVALVCTALAAVLPGAAAAALAITSVVHTTDRFTSNPLATLPDGDYAQVAVSILGASTPDPVSSLSVSATQGATTIPLNFFFFTAPIITDPVYGAFVPFNPALTGSWSVTATDSIGTSAPALTPAIANPQMVPFVSGITVSDFSTTPTVSWTVPSLAGFDVDTARIRIIDATSEIQLFQTLLPLATTSFAVPGGILSDGGRYIYRVSLEDNETDQFGTHLENRSNAFSNVVQVDEPATVMLLGVGLVGLLRRRRRAPV